MGSSATVLPLRHAAASDAGASGRDLDDTPNQASCEEIDDTVRICGECFGEISWNARVCPHCGKPVPRL